ncbi:MAG: DUF523 domain-containing protein [Deltaproteobacteria bacterium]|nr:DUF523 domain-containing protein [Deltaproteobacteria bacterium]
MSRPVLVSACLLGVRCRYDGKSKSNSSVMDYLIGKDVIPICPEADGGLPTPRRPSRLKGGDGFAVLQGRALVVDDHGQDVTSNFLEGAKKALLAAAQSGAKSAILKENSPSCGLGFAPVDGEHDIGKTKDRRSGVACALLIEHGLEILTERDLGRFSRGGS